MSRMKKAILAMIILFVALGSAAAQNRMISITLKPFSAAPTELYINSKPIRVASWPYTFRMPAGQLDILAKAPGYKDFVSKGSYNKDTTITIIMEGGAPAVPVTPVVQNFALSVVSNVSGAQVFVNDAAAGTAGSTIFLPQGSYSLRVSAPGYNDFRTTVNMNAAQTVTANLSPALVTLTVQSNVAGASVFINSQLQAGSILNLAPGTYTLRVTAPGYTDFMQTLNLTSSQVVQANLVQLTYTLAVSSKVNGAQISINGTLVGTNSVAPQLPPGQYRIVVSVPGYLPFTIDYTLNGNANIVIGQEQFVPISGTVVIAVDKNQNPTVYIDGVKQNGRNDNEYAVSPGAHTIRLVFPTGWSAEVAVNIQAGKRTTITPVLRLQVTE